MNESIEELLTKETPTITDGQMGELGIAVNRLLKQQEEIGAIEEALKAARATERHISEMEIPELMDNLGFESITLRDGKKVAVKDSVQCAIPASQRAATFAWLVKNNHGDLIKTAIAAKFARGEKETAIAAISALKRIGVSADLTENVHPGTLKAWARTEMANGRSLPGELFSVHIVKQTTVK